MAFSHPIPMPKLWVFMGFCLALSSMVGLARPSSKFDELFQPAWASDHLIYEGGEVLKMKLDYSSGAGFQSKSKYMFGKVSVQIKLVEGDSAGTVTAFYKIGVAEAEREKDVDYLSSIEVLIIDHADVILMQICVLKRWRVKMIRLLQQ